MKKMIFAVSALCAMLLLIACSPENEQVSDTVIEDQVDHKFEAVAASDYVVLLYENGLGAVQDHVTTEYVGESLGKKEIYVKEKVAKKVETTFGKNVSMWYDRTWKPVGATYELDFFSYTKGYEGVFATYRTDTKQILQYRYVTKDKIYDRTYQSEVNPNSSEEEVVAYAKKIFLEHAGVSVEGWDMELKTWREEYGYTDGFMQYSHDIPAYNAEYIFTFSKKISGVERYDHMTLHMTNVGQIIEFDAVNHEQAFAPYEEVQIDKSKIEEAAWMAFGNAFSAGISDARIDQIKLIPQDGKLWAQVMIEYTVDVVNGGVIYVIEVAKLP